MSNQQLDILKWNVDFGNTTSGGRNNYVPFVIVQPTLGWLAQAKANDNILYVEITDSGIYDGGYRAVLEPTSSIPNPRPNFFAATGTYALTLVDAVWSGYPPNGALGKVRISDGIVTPGQGYVTPSPIAERKIADTAKALARDFTVRENFKPDSRSAKSAKSSDSDKSSSGTPWYVWLIFVIIGIAAIAFPFLL